MNETSLLGTCAARKPLREEVFSDLGLDHLFTPNACRILRAPCDTSLLKERQELFRCLQENEVFRQTIEKLLTVSQEVSRFFLIYRKAKLRHEKLFSFARLAASYRSFFELLFSLRGICARTDAVCQVWDTAAHRQTLTDLSGTLKEADRLIENARTVNLSFMDKIWLSKSAGGEPYCEQLAALAQALDVDPPRETSLHIAADVYFADAYEAISAQTLDALTETWHPFEALDFHALTDYAEELSFVLEICRLQAKAQAHQISTCFPQISHDREIRMHASVNISLLADASTQNIVPNDVSLNAEEHVFFLIGANGGGKTTYLRALGINTVLFMSGCPIFAREARIYPFSSLMTHFSKDERFAQIGRLDEERLRMEQMLADADMDSIFLLNETYSGTDEARGTALSLESAERMREKGIFALFVTHFPVAEHPNFPVLCAEVDPSDQNKRLYRIRRADRGNSYAGDILKKYGLDPAGLDERRRIHEAKSDQPSV